MTAYGRGIPRHRSYASGRVHSTIRAVAVRKQIVTCIYRLPKTPLVFMSDDVEVMTYALAHGLASGAMASFALARAELDCSPRYAVFKACGHMEKAPVVFEWYGDYDYLKSQGWSFDAAVNFMLNNHVSMINDNVGRVSPRPCRNWKSSPVWPVIVSCCGKWRTKSPCGAPRLDVT